MGARPALRATSPRGMWHVVATNNLAQQRRIHLTGGNCLDESQEGVDQRNHSRGEKRSEEHTSELQSHLNLVCRLLLEKKKKHQLENLCIFALILFFIHSATLRPHLTGVHAQEDLHIEFVGIKYGSHIHMLRILHDRLI